MSLCSIFNPCSHINISIICNIIIDAICNVVKVCRGIVSIISYYLMSITHKGSRQRTHIPNSIYMYAYYSIAPL